MKRIEKSLKKLRLHPLAYCRSKQLFRGSPLVKEEAHVAFSFSQLECLSQESNSVGRVAFSAVSESLKDQDLDDNPAASASFSRFEQPVQKVDGPR